ncbi:hypothetical protein K458DRAFT_390503 [Lentithecium fluviatile CBS 122367]|uniref:Uncharacterized protein n=1 Tax=Lentithecium fluviatile CBS 122367 TaxID=1168545 RepID=A0A6G1IWE6_9PLEO|nr:hypothetical protein K458DRAFT_390503 [Lentithecium fluviatile CBS 122367]
MSQNGKRARGLPEVKYATEVLIAPPPFKQVKRLNLTAISFRNQVSQLLRIPGELRDMIYEFVLGGLQLYVVKDGSDIFIELFDDKYPFGFSRCPSRRLNGPDVADIFVITQVCRQTHSESCLLPFKLDHFYASFVGPHIFNDFLRKLCGAQRNAISSLGRSLDELDFMARMAEFDRSIGSNLFFYLLQNLCGL